MAISKNDLKKVSEYIWEITKEYRSDMKVPARVFANEKLIENLFEDRSLEQLVNVATLPGIQKWALSMPDIHEGYGFPIGGVAAFDVKEGMISPGGIGYDINCGVRLIKTPVTQKEIQEKIGELATHLYNEVPSGVGKGGRLKLVNKELDEILLKGVDKMVESGYATEDDKEHCESEGRLTDADPSLVSKTAKDRGRDQLGTIGAGNHFVEVQRVEQIFDKEAAKRMGLFENQITIMVHCGSRGLGHQNATDYIRTMTMAMTKYGIKLPDPELACAPFNSPEGQNYWKSMAACANFAWANRQFITWEIREAWAKTFQVSSIKCQEDLKLVYDVAHNLAKVEEHNLRRSQRLRLVVHRKGATRSFPDQPVLIPGSMGTASYVLVGAEGAMELSFGSSCHGAGRVMSRTKAKKAVRGSTLKQELESQGIAVRSGSMAGLAEEAPVAYKDVEEVVDVVHGAGLAKKVARLKPVAVVKG
jgi:tRNA-splicing ligase RtcB